MIDFAAVPTTSQRRSKRIAAMLAAAALVAGCGGGGGVEGPVELVACLDSGGFGQEPYHLDFYAGDPDEVELWIGGESYGKVIFHEDPEGAEQSAEDFDDETLVGERATFEVRDGRDESTQEAVTDAVRGCFDDGDAGEAPSDPPLTQEAADEAEPADPLAGGTPEELIGCLERAGYDPEPWESEIELEGQVGAVVVSDGLATVFATFFEEQAQAERDATPERDVFENDDGDEVEVIRDVLAERVSVAVYEPDEDTVPAMIAALQRCLEGEEDGAPAEAESDPAPSGPAAETPAELIECLERAGHEARRAEPAVASEGELGSVEVARQGAYRVAATFFEEDGQAEETADAIRPFIEGVAESSGGPGGVEAIGSVVVERLAGAPSSDEMQEALEGVRTCLGG